MDLGSGEFEESLSNLPIDNWQHHSNRSIGQSLSQLLKSRNHASIQYILKSSSPRILKFLRSRRRCAPRVLVVAFVRERPGWPLTGVRLDAACGERRHQPSSELVGHFALIERLGLELGAD